MNRLEAEKPRGNISGAILTALMCLLGSVALVPPSSLGLIYYHVVRDCISVMIAAAMGMTTACAWAAGRLRLRLCAGHAVLFLFVVSGALSVVYCVDRTAGLGRACVYFSWFVVTVAGFLIFRERKNLLNYARWMAIVAIVVCIIGILEDLRLLTDITTDMNAPNRIGSTLGYPTIYAGWLLALIFLMQCCRGIAERKLDRALMGAALVLLIVNLYYCRILTSWIVFVVFEAVCLAPEMAALLRSAGNRRIFFAGALIAAAALAIIFTKTNWTYKYVIRFMPEKGGSLREHVDGWGMAWNMARDRPALGFGAGQYDVYLPLYRARAGQVNYEWESNEGTYYPTNTDNFIFNRLIEQGAIGLILFLGVFGWMFAEVFIRSKRLPEKSRRAARRQACGTAAILGYALFHFPFLSPGVWGLIWANAAMLWALLEETEGRAVGQASSLSEKSGAGAAKDALPVPVFRARLAVGTALFALFAFLFYLPLGQWMNDAKTSRGMMLAAGKNMDGARAEFDGALPLIPKSWRYYYFYGRAFSMNRRYGEAAEHLKKAAKLRPHNLLVLRQLRGALLLGGKSDRAELDYYTRKLYALDTDVRSREDLKGKP